MNATPLLAILLAMVPAAARAQGMTYVIPSLSVAEVADSNVFSSQSSAESDVVLRTSPALRAGYRSAPLQLTGRYTFDAEQYRDHPALDDALARQQADLSLRYHAGRTATFATSASYLTTHMPQEFNELTGLNVQRAPATQFTVTPSMTYDLSARTRASVQFEFARSAFSEAAPGAALAGVAPSIVTRTFTFGLDRHLSATDVAHAQYREQQFAFGGLPTNDASPDSIALGNGTSRAMLAGWTRELSALTRATVMAGPRFSGGAVRPELTADIHRRLKSGDVAVSVERTETVALGEAGTIEVERLTASATVRPTRRLELRAGPGISHDAAHVSGLDATVYLVDVAATRALTRWLSIEASYQHAWERGDIPQAGPLAFAHRVFMIRAITTAPGSPGTSARAMRAAQ
ncbi:MAG: hypothetical protein LAO77_04585 [Acidobacteriia bacterium]|nr:hypothetical protein [Terriglobia bacterium]